jgi:hypothetical protein
MQHPDQDRDYRDHNETAGYFIQLIVAQFIGCDGGQFLVVVLVHRRAPCLLERIRLLGAR